MEHRLSGALERGDQVAVDVVMSDLNKVLNASDGFSSGQELFDFVGVPRSLGYSEYNHSYTRSAHVYTRIGFRVVDEFESLGGWFRMAADALTATARNMMQEDMGLACAYLTSLASSCTGPVHPLQPYLAAE
jgi:hypothetical protein